LVSWHKPSRRLQFSSTALEALVLLVSEPLRIFGPLKPGNREHKHQVRRAACVIDAIPERGVREDSGQN